MSKSTYPLKLPTSVNTAAARLAKADGVSLNEKLDKRNMAAHPSGVAFTQLQAEEFIVDLVTNGVLKL